MEAVNKVLGFREEGLRGLHFYIKDLDYPIVAAEYSERDAMAFRILDQNMKTCPMNSETVPTQNKCQKPGSSRDEDGQRGKSWETPINQGKTRVFEARTTRPLTNKMRISRFFAASARKTQKTAGKS